MNKSEFLDAMRSARAEWEALLDDIGEARMTAPSLPNDWSVKDLIAHHRGAAFKTAGHQFQGYTVFIFSQDVHSAAVGRRGITVNPTGCQGLAAV